MPSLTLTVILKIVTALKSIRTYLIRRRILGLTQGENKNIVTISKRIFEIAGGKISMLQLLTNMIYRLRIPNDVELSLNLKLMPKMGKSYDLMRLNQNFKNLIDLIMRISRRILKT